MYTIDYFTVAYPYKRKELLITFVYVWNRAGWYMDLNSKERIGDWLNFESVGEVEQGLSILADQASITISKVKPEVDKEHLSKSLKARINLRYNGHNN